MKTRSFVLGMFAFAALCACNKEAQPAAPEVLDADAYVKVNIMATPSTKAFEKGEENSVKNALFLFFDASGAAVRYATETSFTWDENETGENVAKSATIKFPAKDTKPASMLVVLNYSDESKYTGKSLNTVLALLEEALYDGDYFLMTNSVYAEDGNAVCATALTDANFGKTNTEDALVDAVPVNVYVERVAAKVLLTDNTDGNITGSEIDVNTGSITETMTLTPVVVGFDIVETPKEAYSFKRIDTGWTYTDWNDASNFRSYWAETTSHSWEDPTDYSYKVANTFGKNEEPIYLFENTSATTTKVVLVAQLKDGSSNAVDLVRYNNTYYTLDAFKEYAAEVAATATGQTVNVGDLSIESGKGTGPLTNNYEMYFTHTNDDVKAVLKGMTAMYWNDGYTYYFTDIKHDIDNLSGVVRNHVYKLSLNSIQGLGVSVPDPTKEIDPETPSAEYYSLNATVNILSWKIVEQSVDFNN